MSKKTTVTAPEPEVVDYFCPACKERWPSAEEGHAWEFDPETDRLECPFYQAQIIRVSKFGL